MLCDTSSRWCPQANVIYLLRGEVPLRWRACRTAGCEDWYVMVRHQPRRFVHCCHFQVNCGRLVWKEERGKPQHTTMMKPERAYLLVIHYPHLFFFFLNHTTMFFVVPHAPKRMDKLSVSFKRGPEVQPSAMLQWQWRSFSGWVFINNTVPVWGTYIKPCNPMTKWNSANIVRAKAQVRLGCGAPWQQQ